jgi:Tol biopolymer transport system component
VAAVLLVAFVAYSVLRPQQSPWNPSAQVARVAAPTAAPAAKQAEEGAGSAAAPAAAPAPAAQEAPVVQQQEPAATAAPEPATMAAAAPTPEPEQPAAMAAAAAPTEAAADLATTPALEPTATTETATLLAKAAPDTPEPEVGAAAMGRGGGGAEGPGIPTEFLTPEPTPPGQPLATVLPTGLRFAYADLNSLWAVDRDGGTRQLVQGRGINTPQLSPDQQWIAYRVYTDKGPQLWAVRWDGGEPKLLLDDANLPTDRLPAGYVRRAFNDSRWGPGNKLLSVTLSLVPDPQKPLQPILELWLLNVDTGELKFSNELGRAWRPFYSPTGKQYLTVAYGTEEAPQGAVTLYDTANGKATTALTFPAGPGKLGYDSQVAWAPNGSEAWVAIPTADNGVPSPPNGTALYRVNSGGQANEVNDIDAYQVYWSPDGERLAYTRYISDTLAVNELYIADADGSNPQFYATMTDGQFISWSPTGKRFLYQDNYQVFAGAPGEPPVRLANGVSMVGPRWVSDDQIMAYHDTGDGWLLVLRNVNGDAAGLLPLPRDAMWDVGTRS